MARDVSVEIFQKGVFNSLRAELIERGSASDALNWRTRGDKIELNRGRVLIGAEEEGAGEVCGHYFAHDTNGNPVQFRKISTKIQYFNTTTEAWVDVITGLTDRAQYSFTEYFSLAGAFVYIGGVDGLYKIVTANPGSYTSLYDDSINFKGKIMISTSRMFLWDRVEDKTGLYLSYIDEQNYTTVTAEVLGALGSNVYSGTLAFKAGGATRTCFGVAITDGTETFRDNFDGTLTGSLGGTGTINYTTGAYSITFNSVTSNSVTAEYQWENSNDGGVTDFTFSTPNRLAGEGDVFRQDQGGDKIHSLLEFDGKYYSIKKNSIYELNLTQDDTNATNLVFRRGVGIQWWRSAISTGDGIVFMDTGDQEKPRLTRLTYNLSGDNLQPIDLVPDFDFSAYAFDKCVLTTWGESIVLSARRKGSASNDRTFIFNTRLKSLDIVDYPMVTLVNERGVLYGGEAATNNVLALFSGFDDDEFDITNFWESNDDKYDVPDLKKFTRFVVGGGITPTIDLDVYISYDEDEYQLIGTIEGDGEYVDQSDSYTIGSTEVGETEIGGGGPFQDSSITVYRYFREFRVVAPKFYKRRIKFVARGGGYVSVEKYRDKRVLLFKDEMPKKYRASL